MLVNCQCMDGVPLTFIDMNLSVAPCDDIIRHRESDPRPKSDLMPWPLSQDYNEAIQSPTTNFADPDLKRGEAVANAMGLPMPCSGNFADVYQMCCADGSRWAVKCFTREVPGLRERYQVISDHLRQARLPFTVDFSYLDQGIRVAGKWYPILKMQWVEGLTLNQFVSQHVDKPAMLEALAQIWRRMAQYLRAPKWAIAICNTATFY